MSAYIAAFHRTALPVLILAATAVRLGAQQPERTGGNVTTLDTATVVILPEVVVTATRETQRLAETAASVGVVTAEQLRVAKPTHPGDVMSQIPGVWVGATGGEGHMTAIRLPKSTDPVYLFLEDGVPTRSTGFFNHNALYEVNVPQAERIEVLKGPATALYGSDAIGGVVNVETRRAAHDPEAEVYLESGAHGWARALLSASGTRGADGVRADANLTRTQGWREGTDYDRQSATLRWDRYLHDGATLRTVVSLSRIDQQTAGSSSLLEDDYRARPTVNYAPISSRKVRAARVSSAYERHLGATLLSVTPYARWNEMELLPNWALTYDPTVYTTGHSSLGVLAKVRHDVDALRARVIAGVDVDHSPGGRLEHRITPVRQGQFFTDFTRAELLYDYDVTFRSVSPYLQVEAVPIERVHLTAGLRYDHIGYDYRTALEPLQTGRWRRPPDTEIRYDHLSPKLGATYELGRALSVFSSYTHGFRAPSEGQIFRQGSAINTVGLQPVVANSYEAGMRGELFSRVGYTLAAYRMTMDNDILTYIQPDGIRETQNAGETLHRGVEVGVGVLLAKEVRADVSFARSEHTYRHWAPAPGVDYGGNEIVAAPASLLNTRLGYTPGFLPGGRLAVEWSRVDAYWMDPENSHRYPGHDLFNLHLNVPLGYDLELVGRLMNIADERFAETAIYTAARGAEYAPGMPRTLYLGGQYRWQKGDR